MKQTTKSQDLVTALARVLSSAGTMLLTLCFNFLCLVPAKAAVPTAFRITSLEVQNANVIVRWQGGGTTNQLQRKSSLTGSWENLGLPTTASSATNPVAGPIGFFRVMTVSNNGGDNGGALSMSMGGGGGETATANRVAVDHEGNTIVVGQFTGHINLGDGVNRPCAGSQDMFIAKYNPLGVLVWGKTFGGPFDDIAYGVAVDSSDNVIVIGNMGSAINFGGLTVPILTGPDVFVVKYSASGVHQWSKCFGSAYADYGYAVAVDASDNVLIGGVFQYGPIDFGGGPVAGIGLMNGFVAKLNSQGANVWAKAIGGSFSDDDRIKALTVNKFGDVIIAGYFGGTCNFGNSTKTSVGGSDIFIAAYSGINGANQWSKAIGSTASDSAFGVACDPNNADIVITGAFGGSINFGGGTVSANVGATALFVARYTVSGAYLWSHTYGGEQYQRDIGYGIAVDATGRVAVTGQIMSAVDFGGGWLFGSGSQDYFAVTYTSAGGYLWAERVNYATVGCAATFNSSGNLITAGFCGPGQTFGGTRVNLGGASCAGFAVRYSP